MEKNCKICSKSFLGSKAKIYCSYKCRYPVIERRSRHLRTKCVVCTEKMPEPSRIRIFCSIECRLVLQRVKNYILNNPNEEEL